MEPILLSIGSVLGVLVIWTAISFYLPTRTMRALIKGMEDIKKGNVKRYDHDDFIKEIEKERRWDKKHPVRAKIIRLWYSLRAFWFDIPDMPRDVFNEIKYMIQRACRGWSNRDAWSVGGHISRLVHEMLRHHKKVAHGYYETILLPKGISLGDNSKAERQWDKANQKQWKEYLGKMIYAFKLNTQIAEGDRDSYVEPKYLRKMKPSIKRLCKYLSKEEEQARQEGMALFIKYLHVIWD